MLIKHFSYICRNPSIIVEPNKCQVSSGGLVSLQCCQLLVCLSRHTTCAQVAGHAHITLQVASRRCAYASCSITCGPGWNLNCLKPKPAVFCSTPCNALIIVSCRTQGEKTQHPTSSVKRHVILIRRVLEAYSQYS